MKLILTVITIFTISTFVLLNLDLNEKKNNIQSDLVVFDGFEGNLYFFTNSFNEALTIEDTNSEAFNKYSLKDNNHVGAYFKLLLNSNQKSKNNYFSSTSVVDLKLQ